MSISSNYLKLKTENEKLRATLEAVIIPARKVVTMSWPPTRQSLVALREALTLCIAALKTSNI